MKRIRSNTTNYNKCEIIIRPDSKIKSRQWWNKQYSKIRNSLLKSLIKKEIAYLTKKCSITLLITNNKEILKLNKRFRNKNEPTDVLSFHLNKKEQIKNNYLGDIVISLDKAKEESQKKKIKLEDELKMLLIHGYLHLLGYDHKQDNDARLMFGIQSKILKDIFEK